MCTFPMIVQLRGTSQGIWREILGSIFGKYKLSAKMMGLRASVAETDVVVVSGNGIVNGVLRGNGVDVRMVHPHPSLLISRGGLGAGMAGRGGLTAPLCFSPRLRGKDGRGVSEPQITRERGINRRALSPVLWVPACAGMTVVVRWDLRLSPSPPAPS